MNTIRVELEENDVFQWETLFKTYVELILPLVYDLKYRTKLTRILIVLFSFFLFLRLLYDNYDEGLSLRLVTLRFSFIKNQKCKILLKSRAMRSKVVKLKRVQKKVKIK